MQIKFIKMNGAGNDFVIIDARNQGAEVSDQRSGKLTPEQIRTLSARDNQVTGGCDQLLILEKSESADIFMRIYNADGGEVDACGNATRCVADMLYKELNRLPVTIQTNVAILQGVSKQDGFILVDMGAPKFDWQDIPLSMTIEEATKKVEGLSGLENPIFVNMGNPHVVFFMDELPNDEDVAKIGSKIENYTEVFPQRVNVSFAKNELHIIEAKVWERGAGLTKACGTGACAMLAAANIKNKTIDEGVVFFINSYPIQSVQVKIEKNNHILLGGAVEVEFERTVEI